MVLESLAGITGFVTGAASALTQVNPVILLVILVLVVIVVFYVIRTLIKIAMVGLFSALLVIAANFVGLPIPISVQTLLSAAILGIMIFTALVYLEIAFKLLKAVTSPLRKAVSRKKPSGDS